MLVDFVGQHLKPTPSKISIADSITPEKFFQCSLLKIVWLVNADLAFISLLIKGPQKWMTASQNTGKNAIKWAKLRLSLYNGLRTVMSLNVSNNMPTSRNGSLPNHPPNYIYYM